MPLDPLLQSILEQLRTMPPLESLPVPQARMMLEAMSANHGEKIPLARVENRKIPGPSGEVPVRIYTPEAPGPLPILVFYHGGGWVLGSLETHDDLCRVLARAASTLVISVDYRLAPEHPFPAGLEDSYAALLWAAENAASLGGDPARIAVGGDSAGGNLGAVVCLLARDRQGPRVAHQLLIYPATDLRDPELRPDNVSLRENSKGYMLTEAMMRWFSSHYITPDLRQEAYASPLLVPDLTGLPPATVITAEFDPLRDEGEAYAARLRESGGAAEATRYDGMVHGFITMPMFLQAREAIELAAAALRRAFAA